MSKDQTTSVVCNLHCMCVCLLGRDGVWLGGWSCEWVGVWVEGCRCVSVGGRV